MIYMYAHMSWKTQMNVRVIFVHSVLRTKRMLFKIFGNTGMKLGDAQWADYTGTS